MEEQFESFPCLIREFKQFDGKPGRGRAVGENEVAYFVKGDRDGRVCATEWICTSIADSLNLAVPRRRVLRMPRTGELVFGSQALDEVLPDYELGRLLKSGKSENGLLVGNLASVLSQIFAFDLFIGNHDRHFGNYLMDVRQAVDGSTRSGVIHVFDFESGDIIVRERLKLPMNTLSQTIRDGRIIRTAFPFDSEAASRTLTQLRKGREFIFQRAMHGLPVEWLSDSQRSDLMTRVASPEFEAEIVNLEQGLSSGPYL